MLKVGSTLLNLIAGAQSELTVVAPFIKAEAFTRLVDRMDGRVQLTCVTRWHPHEIKAGVSDIGIWDIIRGRAGARLFLVPTLHAKYYRADGHYLAGSANVTMTALGWCSRPNIELLIPGEVSPELQEWEAGVLCQGTEVDESLARHIRGLVADFPEQQGIVTWDSLADDGSLGPESSDPEFDVSQWLPQTRYPEQLYQVYSGHPETVSAGANETVVNDLMALAIPRGLDERGFRVAVAAVLLQMPLIGEIDRFVAVPRTFGAVRGFLKSRHRYPVERDPTTDWQTIMRWFRFFLPQRFQLAIPSHSEIIFRIGHAVEPAEVAGQGSGRATEFS